PAMRERSYPSAEFIRKSNTATFGIPVAGPRCTQFVPPLTLVQTPMSAPTNNVPGFCGSTAMQLIGKFAGGLISLHETGLFDTFSALKTCSGCPGMLSSNPDSVT